MWDCGEIYTGSTLHLVFRSDLREGKRQTILMREQERRS